MLDYPFAGVLDGEATGVARTVLGELSESSKHPDRISKSIGSNEFEAMHLHAVRDNIYESYVSDYKVFARKPIDLRLCGLVGIGQDGMRTSLERPSPPANCERQQYDGGQE